MNLESFPGILVVLGTALVARWLGGLFPVVGGPVLAIALGLLLSGVIRPQKVCQSGVLFCSRKLLQAAIVLLGAGIHLGQIRATGSDALLLIGLVLATAFITAYVLGRAMKLPGNLVALIGTGTAICGGSAIAALAPIIEAEDDDITFAITTIFLFNVAAVVVFPLAAYALGMSDYIFGLWAGTAINDTSSVLAAAYSYSFDAGVYATIVKLARTTALIPVAVVFSVAVFLAKRRQDPQCRVDCSSLAKTFPWFIVFFLILSVVNSVGLLPTMLSQGMVSLSRFLILMALAAVGMNADLRKMVSVGIRPILLGGLTWTAVSLISLAVIRLFY